ncbi:MAG: tetratricopeptide repeat protein [Xenococcaceae cyanobacterium]
MLRQIWQWLKGFFKQLFGPKSTKTSSGKSRPLNQRVREEAQEAPPQLTDTDYEFLFGQLLEGVAHGWHEGRIAKFFEQLGERGKQEQWVAWLKRFGGKVLASPSPNHQLAARMVQLGEVTQSVLSIREIGQVAREIGQQLLTRSAGSTVWEYDGPDAGAIQVPANEPSGTGEQDAQSTPPLSLSTPEEGLETITLERFFLRLQQDAELAEQIAKQLGIETTEPQVIIEALINQLNTVKTGSQTTPDTVEGWFNRGLEQANIGDLESAIASWDKALQLNPNFSQAWHNRGSALVQLRRLEEAIASFDKVTEIKPDNYQAWYDRGNGLYNLERWEEAIASWDKVIEIQPDYYQAWYNRGCALEHLERSEESIASYEKALEIKPDFQPAKSRLSHLLGNRDRTSPD